MNRGILKFIIALNGLIVIVVVFLTSHLIHNHPQNTRFASPLKLSPHAIENTIEKTMVTLARQNPNSETHLNIHKQKSEPQARSSDNRTKVDKQNEILKEENRKALGDLNPKSQTRSKALKESQPKMKVNSGNSSKSVAERNERVEQKKGTLSLNQTNRLQLKQSSPIQTKARTILNKSNQTQSKADGHLIQDQLKSKQKPDPSNSDQLRAKTKLNQTKQTEQVSKKTEQPRRLKYLIYVCDDSASCGGWGDRQRGIVNAYLLAVVTRRRFGLRMTVPCDVTNFYVPKDVSWVVTDEELRQLQRASVRHIHNVGNQTFHTSLLKIDFNKEYPEDVVFLRTNVEHFWSIRSNPHYRLVLPSWARHGRPLFVKTAWNVLMKPSPRLRDLLRGFLDSVGYQGRQKPLVCAHVRIGVSSSNPKDSDTFNSVSSLGPLWDFLAAHVSNGSQIFVATDNQGVRAESRKRFGSSHHDTGGTILHVDKQRGQADACLGFETALLEQLVLTQCDVLVTSKSMFSGRAALIRGTSDGLFSFDAGVVKKINLA